MANTNKSKLRSLAAIAILLATTAVASAQSYPNRPIRIIVPTGPGGGYDVYGRLVGDELGRRLKQSVYIENRTGAGTVVAHAIANSCGDQGIHHGKLSAIGLLASLRFLENREAEKLASIHQAMKLPKSVTVEDGLRDLMVRLNLPTTLSGAGYRARSVATLAQSCVVSHFNRTCPRRPTEGEYAKMISDVLG